jgi:hypothetical protein
VPTEAASIKRFEDRLLGSREPYATFALANSLAGFLLGPLLVLLGAGFDRLVRGGDRDQRSRRVTSVVLGAVTAAMLLVCLVLTKSRSAYLGLLVGCGILFWPWLRRTGRRGVITAAATIILLIGTVIALGVATRQLDLQVLSESTKSLGYRWEYWQGAWGVIQEKPWSGHGPGNFGGPYLRHKLPTSSEDIRDAHNFFLETWSAAGLGGLLALVLALGLALRNLLKAARVDEDWSALHRRTDALWPKGPGWIVACGGLGGLLLVVALGQLNPLALDDSLDRWLLLAAGYGLAVVFGLPLWRSGGVPALAAGAAVVGILVNLLAAEGIAIPAVAIGLWSIAALGQNLCEDRPCGMLKDRGGRVIATVALAAWAALVGTFWGTVAPFWKTQAALAAGQDALRSRGEDTARADAYYREATDSDRYSALPWLARANLEFQNWMRSREKTPGQFVWARVDSAMRQAMTPPRNPDAPALQKSRMQMARAMLENSSTLLGAEVDRLKRDLANAARRSVALNPTDARLRAEGAEALRLAGEFDAAREQMEQALALDAVTPHTDRKLPDEVRARLKDQLQQENSPREPVAPGSEPRS